MNQELINHETYEMNTLKEVIDTVLNLNNRTIAVEREPLNRTLYYDMSQVQISRYSDNYIGKTILYPMAIRENT